MKGRRVRSSGKFVQPSVEEINNEIQRKVDYEVASVLEHVDKLEAGFINVRQQEAKIKWRFEQLGYDEKGEKIEGKQAFIHEKFQGGIKPDYMLEAELNADLYNYKALVMDFEAAEHFLKSKGFTDEDIKTIKLGKFDKTKWHIEHSKKVKDGDQKIEYSN